MELEKKTDLTKKIRSDFLTYFVSEEAMAMSFDDGLNTPPPDYEEAVKKWGCYVDQPTSKKAYDLIKKLKKDDLWNHACLLIDPPEMMSNSSDDGILTMSDVRKLIGK